MKANALLENKTDSLVTVRPDATVADATRVMVQHRTGSVLIVGEEGELMGIFTERDLLGRIAQSGIPALDAEVRTMMTKDLIIGTTDDEVEHLLGVMTQQHIRHLPIYDGKKLAGVLSIGDLVKARLGEAEYHLNMLNNYIEGTYPA